MLPRFRLTPSEIVCTPGLFKLDASSIAWVSLAFWSTLCCEGSQNTDPPFETPCIKHASRSLQEDPYGTLKENPLRGRLTEGPGLET
jgi:hypothetical protein